MITENEIFNVCQNYLVDVGIHTSSIKAVLNSEKYDAALVSTLSSVNVVKANRTASKKSNQTHIHITGEAMQVFYPNHKIDSVLQSTTDDAISITMFAGNFSSLKRRYLSIQGEPNVESISDSPEAVINMSTVKKISFRHPTSRQVQISKVSRDSDNFTELRRYLFEGDSLCLFKETGSYDRYFLVALPSGKSLTDNTNQKHNLVKITRENSFLLRDVTPDTIATVTEEVTRAEYSLPNEEAQINTIEVREEKNRQHQSIVRRLAQKILDSSSFKIMAGNIDCFAVDEERNISLIFEVKTLDSSPEFSSEVSQVRKAFAQLFYYDALAKNQFQDVPSKKIAVFSRAISKSHKEFFEYNNCSVIWLENNEFYYNGEDELISNIFN